MPDLTNLDRVKRILKYDSTKTADDTELRQIITAASRDIVGYLNRHVIQSARTETYNIEFGQKVVHLKGYPIDATATLEFRTDFNRAFTGSAISSSNYRVDSESGIVYFDRYELEDGPGVFQAIYTGGMAQSVLEYAGTASGISGALAAAEEVEGQTNYGRGKMIAIVSATATTFRLNVMSGFFEDGETVKSAADAHSFNVNTITSTPLAIHEKLGSIIDACEEEVIFRYHNRQRVGVVGFSAEGASFTYNDPPGVLRKETIRRLRKYRREPVY